MEYLSILIGLDLIILTLLFYSSLLKMKYNHILSFAMAMIIATTSMGTLYTFSLLFNINFIVLLWLPLMGIFGILRNYKYLTIRLKTFDFRFLLICWVGLIVFLFFTEKWGEWDAWAIWNLHAKFLYFEESWTRMLDNNLSWSHPDYPLLLPSVIAMFWKMFQGVYAFVPITVACINFLLIILLLYSVSKPFNYVSFGVLLLLIADFNFMNTVSSQYADSILALLFLVIILILTEKPVLYMLWVGVLASIALSVKNEGFIFLVVLCLYTLFYETDRWKKFIFLGMGVGPLLSMTLYYKIFYAPANDLLDGQSFSTFAKLIAPERYFHILRFGLETLFAKYYTFILLVFLFYKYKVRYRKEFFILGAVFCMYLIIYLITPRDLLWHMSTSMKRLFHHLYPAAIYLLLKSTDLETVNTVWKNTIKNFQLKTGLLKNPKEHL